MVKPTSFDLYCAYNIFFFTFRRNPWVLIERKASGVNYRKNRGPTKPHASMEAKMREITVCTAILLVAQLCCHARKVARGACAARHGRATTFLGARLAMRRGTAVRPSFRAT